MGKNSKPKKSRKKGLTPDQKTLRKEVRAAVKEADRKYTQQKEEIYKDVVSVVSPVAFKEAVIYVIALGQMVNRDKFGHGKKRMDLFAETILFHHEAICEGRATYADVAKEVFDVTGKLYEYDEEAMTQEMIALALKKKEERNAKH